MWSYETALRWTSGATGIEQTANRPDMTISAPPEFGGRDDLWNPELLLVASVESCMLLTSLSVAQRQKIQLNGYASKAVGRMAKTPDGLRFLEIAVSVTLTVDGSTDAAAAARIVHIAEKYCPVSNAVKCPVIVSVDVQTA
jgi:organic hydroperoxide reductase OsmC/OhrA